MEKTRTYATHPAAFIDQPVATPHQSFLSTGSEVPFDKKSSFPPGEAKNSKTVSGYHSTEYTPSVSPFGLTAFNSGMIATGNHNFERFAALCNTLSGEPRRLRRMGHQVGDPYGCIRLSRRSHICNSCDCRVKREETFDKQK